MTMPVPSTRQHPGRGTNGGRPTYAHQMSDGAWGRNYAAARFKSQPITLTVSAGGVPALPTAVAAQTNILSTPGQPLVLEMNQITAQTLLPRLVAGSETKGLEIALDQVNNETVEYVVGGNHAANPYLYVAGTSNPATFRVSLELTTNNGIDQMVIGWRKVQAYTVAGGFITAVDPIYTDFAAIGFAAAVTNPNTIRTATNLSNSGASTITSTGLTWASGLIHTLEVRLIGRRAFYFVNGKRLGDRISKDGAGNTITGQDGLTPPSYTFTAGLSLVPFIFIRQDAGLSTVFLSSNALLPAIEVGGLSEMGLDNNNLQQLPL